MAIETDGGDRKDFEMVHIQRKSGRQTALQEVLVHLGICASHNFMIKIK